MRFFLLVPLFLFSILSFSQTSLSGKVTDAESGEPIILALVALFKNGVLVTGTETDFDGFYSITEIEAGIYDLEFSYAGYDKRKIDKLEIMAGKSNKLDAKLRPGGYEFFPPCGGYVLPLISQDDTTQGMKFTSDQIRQLPFRGH